MQPIIARAREADATFLGGVALHLRGEVKDVFFGWLREKRPDLVPEYERLYGRRAYMRPPSGRRRPAPCVAGAAAGCAATTSRAPENGSREPSSRSS